MENNENMMLERILQLETENNYLRERLENLKEEHAKSNDKLRDVNALLDTILDNIPLYLFVKDVDNELRYIYWNKAFAEFSQIPASKVIGHTDFEVFPDYRDAQKFHKDDLEVLRTKEPLNRHETYVAADGKSRICQTLKVLLEREGLGPLLIGVSMDITNMEDIEQELIDERLRAEQNMRLRSQFISSMNHKIRTPLNAIVGFANLLADMDDAEKRHSFVDIINQNTELLQQLITDLLDISKIESGGVPTETPEGLKIVEVPRRPVALIADDIPTNTLLLKALLEERFDLLTAIDGAEAVKLYKEHKPDIIFMDTQMPNMDGMEATRFIRSYSTKVPIISVIEDIYDSDRHHSLDAGATAILVKPVRSADLNAVLDKYLHI